jgi:hypothetical protein
VFVTCLEAHAYGDPVVLYAEASGQALERG